MVTGVMSIAPEPSPTAPKLEAWTVIVATPLAKVASALLESGQVIHCACCQRPGRVTRVIVKNESLWSLADRARLRQRRGLG